jgi:cyanate permease
LVSLGLVMGVLGFAESGAAAFGSYLAGYIFDIVGDYQPAFWIGIVVSLIGITLSWRLKPAMRRGG